MDACEESWITRNDIAWAEVENHLSHLADVVRGRRLRDVRTAARSLHEAVRELPKPRPKPPRSYYVPTGNPRGRCPYGMRRAPDNSLVPDPEEQRHLDIMARLRRRGCSYQEIADMVCAQGIRNRRGHAFSRTAICDLLKKHRGDTAHAAGGP